MDRRDRQDVGVTAAERMVLGFLLVAFLSVVGAGTLGISRVAAPVVQAASAHAGPDVTLVLEQGPVTPTDAFSDTPERCDALGAEGLRVILQDRAAESFCLVEETALSAVYVQLLNLNDPALFASRKAQTADALTAAGLDVCRVTLWWVRRDAVRMRVPLTEQYISPTVCAPRVLAHDPAAALWQEFTERTVAAALARAGQDHGVQATMPLTVHLFGSREAYLRHVTAGQTAEATRVRLSETEGVTARGTIEGVWIALDTSRFSPIWPERAAWVIRHEVTHYIQTVIAGCACAYPAWFAEGLADYNAATALGPITTRHLAARAAERAGRAPSLRALESYPSAEATGALYDRGYAAVSYIAERWGADAPGELLRRHRHPDPATFVLALTTVTGLSVDELDRAVSRWLLNARPEGTAAGQMRARFAAAYAVYDPEAGRVEGEGSVFGPGEGQVDVVAAWDCAAGTHLLLTRWFRPDGSLYGEEVTGDGVRCPSITRSRLILTPVVLTTPGRWRVEITADGRSALALDILIGDG